MADTNPAHHRVNDAPSNFTAARRPRSPHSALLLYLPMCLGGSLLAFSLARPAFAQGHTEGGLERAIERVAGAMGTTELVGWVVVTLVGFIGAAFFAGAETGLYAANRVRLRVRAGKQSPRDTLAHTLAGEIDRSDRTLPAMLIGFNVASFVMSLGLTAILTDRGYSEAALVWINVLLITPLTFVFCDTLPKEVFRADADRLAYAASPAIRLWRLLVTYTGVLPLVRFIAAIISRVFAKSAADAPEASRQRMASLLKEGAQSGAISEQQLTLLDQAFALREATVGDEMIPWARVHKLDASMTRPQALRFIQRYPASRFPVVGDRASGSRALVLGVVEHLDLCTADAAAPSIANLARPAPLLTPTTPVRDALRLMARQRTKMAIVATGNPPKPVGIVTIKDLVEPLTGEVRAW